MKELSPCENQVVEATKSALLARDLNPQEFLEIQTKFSDLLKTNFENRNIWLRYGLTISISKCSPQSALQAFNECMRIDQDDPLPAMLAAKTLLEDLDEPEKGLCVIDESVKRCKRLLELSSSSSSTSTSNGIGDTIPSEIFPCQYKDINPLLSRSYLLASVMHAQIYEGEPESIKQFKTEHLKESLRFLDSAIETNPNDHLAYFHKALHQVKQRTHSAAIDNLRHAIQISPHHIPSIQLLILTLSALKQNDKALVLCESTLHEHEDDLLLLYFKCNLEQILVETKGYKKALNTAQHMLKCIRRQGADILANELSIWMLIAEIFVKVGALEDSEMCVDEGSVYASGALSPQVMFLRGLIAKARNNLIEAKAFFQSCLALYPHHPRALQQMAHVHYLLGNHSTAEKFLRYSLDQDGECHKTWHYLSLVLIELNQHERASECAEKSTLLEETSPVVPFSTIPRLTLQ